STKSQQATIRTNEAINLPRPTLPSDPDGDVAMADPGTIPEHVGEAAENDQSTAPTNEAAKVPTPGSAPTAAGETARLRGLKHTKAGVLAAKIRQRKYLPVLISSALMPHARLFYGSPGDDPKFQTLPTDILKLLENILNLPDDPSALQTCYLTTYNTWIYRSIGYITDAKDQRTRRAAGEEDDNIDEDNEGSEDQLRDLKTFCRSVFGRLVYDKLTGVDYKRYGGLLNPFSYFNVARPTAGTSITNATAFNALPAVLTLASIRRTSNSVIPNVNGKDIRIGKSIPQGR
ncbi:MAG: hypothetical protein Q9199_005468, partial [Rusavskia elegans]